MAKRKAKVMTPEQVEEIRTTDFFDCILPGTIKFFTDISSSTTNILNIVLPPYTANNLTIS